MGGSSSIPFQARVVAASKADLSRLVEEGKFRSDLYFRLNVLSLNLPPLRDYLVDLPYLLTHFLHVFGHKGDYLRITDEAIDELTGYRWPGNVRELRNFVERMLIFAVDKEITPADLPRFEGEATDNREQEPVAGNSFSEQISSFERGLLEKALKDADNNQSHAAQSLQMKLSTFRDRCKENGLL